MKISTILNLFERISSIVYHMTDFRSAASIINSDALKDTVKGSEISFTRSITGSYHSFNRIIGILFEVDGDKINKRYKGAPVGTETYDDNPKKAFSGRENGQLEDRVYTHSIENFSEYVRQVYVFIPLEYIKNNSEDGLDGNYAEGLEYFPEVTSKLEKRYGDVKFILNEKDLYNKKYYTFDVAKTKIAEVLEDTTALEISPKLKKYFDIGDEMKILFYVTIKCNDSDECSSDYETHEDPKIQNSGIPWDIAIADLPIKDNDPEKILKSISFNDIAPIAKPLDGESTDVDPSEIISFQYSIVTNKNGDELNDIDKNIPSSLKKPNYNPHLIK